MLKGLVLVAMSNQTVNATVLTSRGLQSKQTTFKIVGLLPFQSTDGLSVDGSFQDDFFEYGKMAQPCMVN